MAQSEVGKALRAARKQRGLNQQQVAEYLGVSRQAVTHWEQGRGIDFDNLVKVTQFLRVDLSKILDVPATFTIPTLPPPQDVEARGALPRNVPVHGTVAGGADADFYSNGEIIDYVRRPPALAYSHGIYALYVVGMSMFPRFAEGELVYVSASRPPSSGDDVVIELHPNEGERSGRGYIKRLVRRTPTKLVCEQFHPAGQVEFDLAKVKNLHRVLTAADLLEA